MKIRKATRLDYSEMYKIIKKEYLKHYKEKWSEKNAAKTFDYYSKIGEIFVLVDNRKIRGFVIIRKEYYNGKYLMNCEELVVDGNYQGKGFGKLLMSYIESYSKRLKIKYISLGANKKSAAFKFYRSLNYVPSKNFVIMEKKVK